MQQRYYITFRGGLQVLFAKNRKREKSLLYIYGQVQFDTSLKFEDLLEDYFSHAYGEDWREVVKIFEKIGKAIDAKYITGLRSADLNIEKRYNPAVADELRQMPAIAEEAKPFLDAHKVMPMRPQTIAYKLMRLYMEYCVGLSKCLIPKCFGAGQEAKELFDAFLADFGRHETEIETYYDQWLAGYGLYSMVFSKKEEFPTVGGQNAR